MPKIHQTEQQDDSAARIAERDGAAAAHVRILLGRSPSDVHEVRAAGTSFGRDTGESICDVEIDDSQMSRMHVRLERSADRWQLVDLGSRNGGFVDGRGLQAGARAYLSDGAVIRLGSTLMVFRASAPASDGRSTSRAFPGVSPNAISVRRRIDALIAATGHVLILGETGTGKERVAQALAEDRRARPFVAQNCAELTSELARSELFGHVKGAFSGASSHKRGLVELAKDGVLFLDEVGELTLEVQGDLLRFLEDGSYRPLGSEDLKSSPARVVAATNVDLDQAVLDKKFRRDLLARLCASNEPLQLAPLRERREDILQWSRLFLAEAGHTTSDPIWTVGALECLLLYPWLDNLRELRRVVRAVVAEHAAFPCPSERLPLRVRSLRSTLRGHVGQPAGEDPGTPRRDPTRDEIEDVLRKTHGSVRSAALKLGIDRRKLYRLCDRFEIALQEHREAARPGDD